MFSRAKLRRLAITLPAVVAVPMVLTTVGAAPAAAHGSVTDPPTRNYGCLERWGDNHLDPAMAETDPMCAGAWAADPNAMWNWNGLYRENVGGRHEEVIPDGQLYSGGQTEGGRYDYMDTPGEWVMTDVDHDFTLTLTDGANHGADYLRIYVSEEGFDPTTEALGWDDLELLTETGSYPTQSPYLADVSIPEDRSGRAVLYTIWQASHLDQPYYLCSDINIGGADTTPDPDPTPDPEPTDPEPEPTDPEPEPTDPEPTPDPEPGTGECTAAIRVVNSWAGGYQGELVVTAGDDPLSGWSATLSGVDVSQAWNGTYADGTLTNAGWNGNLNAGGTAVAGFLANGTPDGATATCSGR
jgi:lytic cellulose monooxygenase (C4-dehydrogenating)